MKRAILCAAFALVWITVEPSHAQNLKLQSIASGLSQPLFVTAPPGDTNRLFVVEKTGAIKIVNLATNTVQGTPYLSIPVNTSSERGLLGLAFDPNFSSNGNFYVDYVSNGGVGNPPTGTIVVARYTANGTPLTSTSANTTGTTLLTIDHTAAENHNGGWLGFSPNNPDNLYVSVGDGGGGGDPFRTGQNTNTLLGKMLRIDVNHDPNGSTPPPYGIPAGNPFATSGGLPEVWDFGLRNAWRPSFDRQTGDLWIADVGQGAVEEINFHANGAAGGVNFGWSYKEGPNPYAPNPDQFSPTAVYIDPIYSYTHASGTGNSITGGYVYRGGDIPGLQGEYLYGDYTSGRMFTLTYNGSSVSSPIERTTQLTRPGGGGFAFNLVSFGEDARGELYLVSIDGNIFKIVPEPTSAALISTAILSFAAYRRRRGRLTRDRLRSTFRK